MFLNIHITRDPVLNILRQKFVHVTGISNHIFGTNLESQCYDGYTNDECCHIVKDKTKGSYCYLILDILSLILLVFPALYCKKHKRRIKIYFYITEKNKLYLRDNDYIVNPLNFVTPQCRSKKYVQTGKRMANSRKYHLTNRFLMQCWSKRLLQS